MTSQRRKTPVTCHERDMLVSGAFIIWPPLQPSPRSEASALRSILAFSNRLAGLLPLLISASRWLRSASLSLTTYFFTATSLAAMAKSFPGFSGRQAWTAANHRIRLANCCECPFATLNQFAAHSPLNLNDVRH